jgi:trans-aconitate methyltransferase
MSGAETFRGPAEAYDRLMGRYGAPLAAAFLDAVGIRAGMRALDVGCGPGALTAALAGRLGDQHVAAVDPSEPFVAACRRRLPESTSRGRPPRRCRSRTTPSTRPSPSSS